MIEAERAAERFQVGLGLTPLFARLLAARGWRETEAVVEFLYPRLEHTHSPWLMLGMEAAVVRILAAIAGGERIRILGDYDADGTLATVILRQALTSLGAQAGHPRQSLVSYHLPHRVRDGYGLAAEALERAAADGVTLAITVDTGIREVAALARAGDLGLDVIVTDHHLPGAELPAAVAILNPHQPGCGYPDKGLCGSGVAFKLAHALLERSGKLEGAWPPALRSYLKLVALATVADAAPLLGENRVLARFGLEGLAQPVNPGLRALLACSFPPDRPPDRPVTSGDVAFRIAPRLNAAGRMDAADQVVELFFAPAADAAQLARALDAANVERLRLCDQIQAEITARLDGHDLGASGVLVVAGENWHRGVLGIVASRLLARTGRPVLVVGLEPRPDGGGLQGHGSGRAPAGFHLLEALETCPQLFDRFGGHAQAVGFSLPAEHLPALEAALAALPAAAAALPPRSTAFPLTLAELSQAFARDLARLEPFGEANPEPVFCAHAVRLAQPPQILKERHLKLVVEQAGTRQTALFWNLWREGVYQDAPGRAEWEALTIGATLDLEFRLETTHHPQYGERRQLILREFFVTAGAAAGSHRTAEQSL